MPEAGCCTCGPILECLVENAHIPDRKTAPNETARLCSLCHRAYDLGLMTDAEILAARARWRETGQAWSTPAELQELWATRTPDWSRLHKGAQKRGGARLKRKAAARRAAATRKERAALLDAPDA